MGWRSDFPLEVWMLRRCRIYRNIANGGFSITVGKYNEVFDNRLLSTFAQAYGLEFVGQSDAKAYRNWVEGTRLGIIVGTYHGWFNTRNIEVFGNVFHEVLGKAVCVLGSDKSRRLKARAHTTNVKVYHNTAVGSRLAWPMFHIWQRGSVDMFDIRIKNNIIVGGKGAAGWTEKRAPDATIRGEIENNIIFGNADNSWRDDAPRRTIAADPMFVNAEQDDFSLRPGSPAIDAAAPVGLNLPRVGRALDIGALEFSGRNRGRHSQ
jgi:hypothetical protein